MTTCNNMVTVAVPTKFDYKLLEVECQSFLSHQDDSYCNAHRNTQTLRCSRCGVNGFLSEDNLNDHYLIDCDE